MVRREQCLYYGLGFAALSSFGAWYYSDRAALSALQARPTSREDKPALVDRKPIGAGGDAYPTKGVQTWPRTSHSDRVELVTGLEAGL